MVTSLEEAFILVSSKFKIPTFNYQQKLGIEKIVSNKKDVFVYLPTGFANLLSIKRFQALVFDHTTNLPASMSTFGRGELPFGKARKTRPKG